MQSLVVAVVLGVCWSSAAYGQMSNVKAIFPSKDDKQGHTRLVLTTPLPQMREITMCHRISSSGALKGNGSFTVSYATGKSPDEFLVGFVPTTKEGEVDLQVSVRDQAAKIRTKLFKLGHWHHVCVSWSAGNGRVTGYIDGTSIGVAEKVQEGMPIRFRGVLMLGQDQDIFNGNFDQDEAWEGAITDFQLWDQVLTAEAIASMAQCRTHMNGNVVSWLKTPFRALNGVVLSEVNLCPKQNNC